MTEALFDDRRDDRDDQDLPSEAQTQWAQIARAVRAGLAKRARNIDEMATEDVFDLVATMDTAMWCELKALTFDEEVQQRKKTLEREALYGG